MDDTVQTLYETLRDEALVSQGPPTALRQRVCQYGVASLVVGVGDEFPFILTVQSVPRPPWSGRHDGHRETLCQVYHFLTQEIRDHANRPLCPRVQ